MRAKSSRKLTHGRVKTKNPMSIPNSGSCLPKGTRCSHSRKVCHWLASAVPLKTPSTPGTTQTASRRRGSSIAR